MRRLALCLVILVGCMPHKDHGPAWPKRADREVDGGESLAPRAASVAVAADDDDDDDKPVVAKAADKPADAKPADKPAATTTTPTTVAPEEVINIDDIVIEIED